MFLISSNNSRNREERELRRNRLTNRILGYLQKPFDSSNLTVRPKVYFSAQVNLFFYFSFSHFKKIQIWNLYAFLHFCRLIQEATCYVQRLLVVTLGLNCSNSPGCLASKFCWLVASSKAFLFLSLSLNCFIFFFSL